MRKMQIHKILNNNAIVSKDENNNEIIVVGNGIGFKNRVGDKIDESKILNIFVLSNNAHKNKLITLLEEIPFECIEITEKIIMNAQEKLNLILNQNLIISLADHINFAIERYKQGIFIPNAMEEEIKRFYKNEWNIGLEAVKMVNEHYNIKIDKSEAASIAFYIVNAEGKEIVNDTFKILERIKVILNLVEEHFGIKLEEDSLDYSRFVIHLKYFIRKVYAQNKDEDQDENENELFFKTIKDMYEKVDQCLDKINDYIKQKDGYELSKTDRMYLMLHIIKIIKNY